MRLTCLVVRQQHHCIELLVRTSFTEQRYDCPSGDVDDNESLQQAAVRVVMEQTGLRVDSDRPSVLESAVDNPVYRVEVNSDIPDRFSFTMVSSEIDIAEYHYRWLPVDPELPTMLVEPVAGYVIQLLKQLDTSAAVTPESDIPNLRQRFSDLLVRIWGNWPIPEWLRGWILRIVEPKYLAGVVGIVFDEQDKVLLVKHTYRRTYPWAPPSGWIKRGEDPTQALEREVFEETGYRIWVGGAIAVGGDKDERRLDLYYRCALLGGEFRPCAEVSDAKLYELTALPEMMEPFHREVIRYAARRPGAALPPRAD